MSRKPATPQAAPKANPDWHYSPPSVSKSGRVVSIDLTQLSTVIEHYRAAGVPLVDAHTLEPKR